MKTLKEVEDKALALIDTCFMYQEDNNAWAKALYKALAQSSLYLTYEGKGMVNVYDLSNQTVTHKKSISLLRWASRERRKLSSELNEAKDHELRTAVDGLIAILDGVVIEVSGFDIVTAYASFNNDLAACMSNRMNETWNYTEFYALNSFAKLVLVIPESLVQATIEEQAIAAMARCIIFEKENTVYISRIYSRSPDIFEQRIKIHYEELGFKAIEAYCQGVEMSFEAVWDNYFPYMDMCSYVRSIDRIDKRGLKRCIISSYTDEFNGKAHTTDGHLLLACHKCKHVITSYWTAPDGLFFCDNCAEEAKRSYYGQAYEDALNIMKSIIEEHNSFWFRVSLIPGLEDVVQAVKQEASFGFYMIPHNLEEGLFAYYEFDTTDMPIAKLRIIQLDRIMFRTEASKLTELVSLLYEESVTQSEQFRAEQISRFHPELIKEEVLRSVACNHNNFITRLNYIADRDDDLRPEIYKILKYIRARMGLYYVFMPEREGDYIAIYDSQGKLKCKMTLDTFVVKVEFALQVHISLAATTIISDNLLKIAKWRLEHRARNYAKQTATQGS